LRRPILPAEIERGIGRAPAEVQGLNRSRTCGGWVSTNLGRVKIEGAGPSGHLCFGVTACWFLEWKALLFGIGGIVAARCSIRYLPEVSSGALNIVSASTS